MNMRNIHKHARPLTIIRR